jgi:copper chaperone CopZ
VSVAIKKVEGVQKVEVSLNDGAADIQLKPGNKLTVDQLREIVRKNGFTAKDAVVTVAGKLIERNGKPALHVTGPDLVLLLEGKGFPERIGANVTLVGRLAETSEAANAPATLVVSEAR